MQLQLSTQDPARLRCEVLVIPLGKTTRLPKALLGLDRALGGRVQAYLDAGGFEGKRAELAGFPAQGIAAQHVVLCGLGAGREADVESIRRAIGSAIKTVTRRGKTKAGIVVPSVPRITPRDMGQALAEGAILGGYRFDRYRTLEKPPPGLETLTLLASGTAQAGSLRPGVRAGTVIAESTVLARDLSNEPGGVATPEWLATQARALGREVGLKVRVLAEGELQREKLGGILAVGRGSSNPPRLIVLEHGISKRGARSRPTVALVGKGITFDSGGISIKPAGNMHEMKHDMSGGAAVFGALRAAALLRLPLHVVGIVPAAQNMPDGGAYLPGDVVRTGAGKTIEILNTDAEGRVVLADGLHYAARYSPDAIVDIATLTGAKIVALGKHACAVLGNDEGLVKRLRTAGDRCGERAWPLPLWDAYKEQIRGDVADLKNTGGRDAGTITAAALLSHFVGETRWAHLDIAGNESSSSDLPYCVRGATGFGARLLVELLRSWR